VSRGQESGSSGAGCTAHLVVAGRVQGVGFRWFTQRAADGLRLSGWVRNRRDGTVEAEVAGERDAVQACIDRLRQGPPGSSVARVDIEWGASAAAVPASPAEPAPGARGRSRFEIRPTL